MPRLAHDATGTDATRAARLFVGGAGALHPGRHLRLPPAAARHVQVLRLQPGAPVNLFDGSGGEWSARVLRMRGRAEVEVELLAHAEVERELDIAVTLAVVMPANDRMDDLVEKATELGAAAVQPLSGERSVLRLDGERAQRKRAHWQAVAAAASEQCGRNRVPAVGLPQPLRDWLVNMPAPGHAEQRLLLSLAGSALPWPDRPRQPDTRELLLLSGPEGGLTDAECEQALAAGFCAVSLGPRVLRADTAPLAALAALALDHAE